MLSQACMTAEPVEAAVQDPPSTGQAGKSESPILTSTLAVNSNPLFQG